MRRSTLAALVLVSVVGCTDGDSSDSGESAPSTPSSSGSTGAASGSASVEPSEDAAPEVPARMPAGTLTEQVAVDLPKRLGADGSGAQSAAFTDSYVVTIAASGRLRVHDRTSLAQLWEQRLPRDQRPCPLPTLARDATTVTVFTVAPLCESVATYDLATGAVVEELETSGQAHWGTLADGRLAFTDSDDLRVVQPDGRAESIATPQSLGAPDSSVAFGDAAVLDGTSTMFVTFVDFLEPAAYVGLSIDGDTVSPTWEVPPKLVAGLRIDSAQAPHVAGGLLYLADDRKADLSLLGLFDEATGAFAAYRADAGEELLASFDLGGERNLRVTDGAVLTSYGAPVGKGYDHLARLDLASGTKAWDVQLPGTDRGRSIDTYVVGLSPDGQYAYAQVMVDETYTLHEVDVATGAVTGGPWPVADPASVATWFQDGDLLVSMPGNSSGSATPKYRDLTVFRAQ